MCKTQVPAEEHAFGQDCSAQLKYSTMPKVYVVLYYRILYYTIELYTILDHKCSLHCTRGFSIDHVT